MSEESTGLHFSDDNNWSAYALKLSRAIASTDHVDALGNICSRVEGEALDITDRVDRGEIDESEGEEQAKEVRRRLDGRCTLGLGATGVCAYNVLCSTSSEWR